MNKSKSIFLKALIIFSLYALIFNSLHANELKIYSERQPLLIEPLLEKFEDQSGIKVEWIYSQKGLVQKAILEKKHDHLCAHGGFHVVNVLLNLDF